MSKEAARQRQRQRHQWHDAGVVYRLAPQVSGHCRLVLVGAVLEIGQSCCGLKPGLPVGDMKSKPALLAGRGGGGCCLQ